MNLGGFHGLKDVCNSLGLTQEKKKLHVSILMQEMKS